MSTLPDQPARDDHPGDERPPAEHAPTPSSPPIVSSHAPEGARARRTARTRRRHRRRRIIVGTVLLCLALGTVGVLIGLALTQERPTWWRTVRVEDPATEAMASAVQNQITSRVYEVRADEDGDASIPWGFKVDAAMANAWLNARLPQWLESEHPGAWPREFEQVQVDFDHEGRIRVGVELSEAFDHRVLSVALRPVVGEDGSLWMEASSVQLGRLPIPAEWVLSGGFDAVSDRVPARIRELPEAIHLFGAFAGEHAMMDDPVVRLGDGRRVRLLGLFAGNGELRVACETILPPPPSRADIESVETDNDGNRGAALGVGEGSRADPASP